MSTIAFQHNSAIFGSIARLISGTVHSVVDFTLNYASRSRAERQLAALDDRLLEDIGLNRFEIHRTVWNGNIR